MKTLYQITAELYQEHVVPIINGKQYDTGRSVLITLTDAGAVVVPESGDMLRLYAKKPDGTVSYLPGTLSGTAVEVELTNQLQALPGVVECELQIGTGAEMVSTPVFRLNVLPSNYDAAAIESSDEFGALETALQTVQQYDTRIAALEDVADGLGDASTYGVANDLTQATAGENVLDAAQGKALGDRLTTAEGDIASLNDGYTQLNTAVALKAGNGEPLTGYCYMSVRSTLGSTTTVTFANLDHNRYVGLLLIESNSNSGAVYSVGYKVAQSPFTTLMAGSAHTVTIGTSGDLSVALPSWSKAVLISTQKFD